MASGKLGMDDLLGMGKQFWDSWSAFAQGAMPGQTPSWSLPADVFGQMAGGLPDEARHAVESLGEQGQQFLRFMQDAAARAGAGDALAAGDVAGMWKRAMADGHPVLDAIRAISGEGARGFDQAGRELAALLAPFRAEGLSWLQTPAFGYTREKQEAWQALMRDAEAHAEAMQAYNALLTRAGQRGGEYFENKLAERSEPGRQIDSVRALYDLWVDAQEEAYAEIALSPEFRSVYGRLANSQMKLRQGMQKQVEAQAASMGMPTRSELDGTHEKIRQQRREIRALQARLAALESALAETSRPQAAKSPARARPAAAAASAKSARGAAPASRRRAVLVDRTEVAVKPAVPRSAKSTRKESR